MKYELAKELKDAGFPQEDIHWYWSPFTEPETLWCVNALHPESQERLDKFVASPTLEELIEACGEEIARLWRVDKSYDDGETKWCATGTNDFLDGLGATPEEAVARLWLALNKKDLTN